MFSFRDPKTLTPQHLLHNKKELKLIFTLLFDQFFKKIMSFLFVYSWTSFEVSSPLATSWIKNGFNHHLVIRRTVSSHCHMKLTEPLLLNDCSNCLIIITVFYDIRIGKFIKVAYLVSRILSWANVVRLSFSMWLYLAGKTSVGQHGYCPNSIFVFLSFVW